MDEIRLQILDCISAAEAKQRFDRFLSDADKAVLAGVVEKLEEAVNLVCSRQMPIEEGAPY
jgi:hypothetical protein